MAKPKRLPKAAVEQIHAAVDALFDKVKVRFLGPHMVDKKLFISYNREKSLPGIYEAAHLDERGIPDREQLDQLLQTAGNYLDALRHKTRARTVVAVQNFIADTAKYKRRGEPEPDIHTVLGGELADLYGQLAGEVKKIIDTETQHGRNIGVVDGIVRANASMGIEDPVVFFVVVRDQNLCDECKRLHLMPNKKTPRLWYMSEVQNGYHQRGENHPNVGGLHPHCRCSMTTLMPGFGFDKSGMVTWKKEGHSEIEQQRKLGKTEVELLDKMAIRDIKPGEVDVNSPNGLNYNYSHLLPEGFRHMYLSAGYQPDTRQISVKLHQNDQGLGWREYGHAIGEVTGKPDERHLEVLSSELAAPGEMPTHHLSQALYGKGLGKALYTALLTHAMHHHGVKTVGGAKHSTMASRVHQSLSREHGMDYKPDKDSFRADWPSGPYDFKMKPYQYTLKSEHQKQLEPMKKYTPEGIQTFESLRPNYHKNGENVIKNYVGEKLPVHPAYVEAIRTAPITMNMPRRALSNFFDSGRYLNLFATTPDDVPYGNGEGETDKDTRRDEEHRSLGISKDVPATKRPVYGALDLFHTHPIFGHSGGAKTYGDYWVVLHPSVKARSSFTPGDSFGIPPDQVFHHEHPEALAITGAYKRHHELIKMIASNHDHRYLAKEYGPGSYLEAQIHGGITPKDIAEIHISHDDWNADGSLRQKLQSVHKTHGIPVFTHDTVMTNNSGKSLHRNNWGRVTRQVLPAPEGSGSEGTVIPDRSSQPSE